MVISERRRLHADLNLAGYYLPPLEDKSLTLRKLQLLRSDVLTSIPKLMVPDTKDYVSNCPRRLIVEAISRHYHDEPPLWFAEGRLPSRKYLLGLIAAFDSTDSTLGRAIPKVTKIRETRKTKCKKCTYRDTRARTQRLNKRKELLSSKQPPKFIYGIDPNAESGAVARILLKSKHSLFALRNGFGNRRMARYFDDPRVPTEIAKLTAQITRIADIISNL